MSTETSCHFGHLLQVLKKVLKNISMKLIIYIFHDFMFVYILGAGPDNPLGTKFLCQLEHLVTLVICCSFKKISLKPDFILFS